MSHGSAPDLSGYTPPPKSASGANRFINRAKIGRNSEPLNSVPAKRLNTSSDARSTADGSKFASNRHKSVVD